MTQSNTKVTDLFVGLDVRKDSIRTALAEAGALGAVRPYGRSGSDLDSLDKVARKLQQGGRRLRFVYEAGPCGYVIYRHLTRQGLDCTVVAPSPTPRRAGDRVKTDRRDATMPARLRRAGELTAVYVPAEEDEAMRGLSRARRCQAGRAQSPAAALGLPAAPQPAL